MILSMHSRSGPDEARAVGDLALSSARPPKLKAERDILKKAAAYFAKPER